jgi:hypothetical protein
MPLLRIILARPEIKGKATVARARRCPFIQRPSVGRDSVEVGKKGWEVSQLMAGDETFSATTQTGRSAAGLVTPARSALSRIGNRRLKVFLLFGSCPLLFGDEHFRGDQKVLFQVPNGLNGLPPTARSTKTSIVFFGPGPAIGAKVKPLRRK